MEHKLLWIQRGKSFERTLALDDTASVPENVLTAEQKLHECLEECQRIGVAVLIGKESLSTIGIVFRDFSEEVGEAMDQ